MVKSLKNNKKTETKQIDPAELVKYSEDPVPSLKQGRVFKFERLSASMLKTWFTCKRKFHMHYVEGVPSEANESFTLGTAVHYALEKANLRFQGDKEPLTKDEIESYVDDFRQMASTLFVSNMNLFPVGEALVRNELNSYDIKSEKIIGVEKEFDLVTPEGVRIYGFIDKLSEIDEDTIKITDYKTSVMPLSYEEARSDEQLSMYDLAIKTLFPEYEKRVLELRYLRSNTSVTSYRTDIETSNFQRQILAVSNSIKEYINNLPPEAPEGELNTFCSWCSYKNACPRYVNNLNQNLPSCPSSLELTDDKFLDQYEKIKVMSKAVKQWEDALKIWAIARMEHNPDETIKSVDGSKEIGFLSTTRREYDVEKLCKLISLKDLLGKSTGGQPLIKVQASALEDYLQTQQNPKLNQQVELLVNIKHNSPQVRIKKVK